MLVECIGNTRDHLVSDRAKKTWDEFRHLHDETVYKKGKKYIVFGVVFIWGEGVPQYLLCGDEYDEFPVPEFAELFKIIDGKIPEDWVFRTSTSDYPNPVILPERIADEYIFMERLYDADPDAVQYFLELKEIMKEKYKDYI